ncbi:MarR family winged helix-turn-helix transcriptional regulator [Bifidobacterium sp.]|jgi:DNA-binding MarR family transcriptional regulator|uniref:MarR family winged helix-turn-helix transcriptional regulator n=1 Tax=Bifidobacterium sp. TaxID=41200 RepID=UPI0025BB408C|nr:MarR family transcriptional regulator [Bifidobacterium sp.]MCH4160227.1 MarR family transcriptional regulator [Bifidobacterium sp.]MCH4175255.1 MarR family transcriptional regulator [Bifidobacterium sp.]MCI1634904.1 MarR family transcriptional regulator [Bifidobacterium sp.]
MKLVECVEQMYFSIVINELKRMRTSGLYRGVSYNGLLYMDLIRHMEDPTVSSIAETLGVAKSSVSQKVSELESRGLVNRCKDELDGRVSHVSIAPEAIDDVSAIDAPIRAALESLSNDYDEKEINTLCAMIMSLAHALDAQTAAERR